MKRKGRKGRKEFYLGLGFGSGFGFEFEFEF